MAVRGSGPEHDVQDAHASGFAVRGVGDPVKEGDAAVGVGGGLGGDAAQFGALDGFGAAVRVAGG